MGFLGFGGGREGGGPEQPLNSADRMREEQRNRDSGFKEGAARLHNETHGESWEAVQAKIAKHLSTNKDVWQGRSESDKGAISENTTKVIENVWGKPIDTFDIDDIRHFREITAGLPQHVLSVEWALGDAITKVNAREKEFGEGQAEQMAA